MDLYPKNLHGEILERINNAITHARKTRFYSEKLKGMPEKVGSLEEFEKWPLTTAGELKKSPLTDRVAIPLSDVERVLASSGGPATSKYFPYSLKDIQCKAIIDDFIALNPPRDGFLLNLIPEGWGGGTLLAQMARGAGMTIVSPPLPMLGAFLPDLLKNLRFKGILSLPTKLPGFVDNLKKGGLEPSRLNLELVLVGGEVVSDWLIDFIEASFHAKVINLYGAIDTGGLGNGPKNVINLYHAHYFEIKDSGLIVTNLDREASVVLRYNLGDDVELIEPGYYPKVKVRGRRVDLLSGEPLGVYALDIEQELLSSMGAFRSYQIVAEGDRYVLEVEARPDDRLEHSIEKMSSRIGKSIELRTVPNGTIEPFPGKYRRIVRKN